MSELIVRELRLRTYDSAAAVASHRLPADGRPRRAPAEPGTPATVRHLAARHSRRRPDGDGRDID